jgi:hypothetical protein
MKKNNDIDPIAMKESEDWFEGIKQTIKEVDELIGDGAR